MEVHPPHAPLHNWKDFWIHLGTITIGLLIAVSLEQSVEYAHRMHERHVLQEDLREEGLRNRELVATDFRWQELSQRWIEDVSTDIKAMRASHGKLKLPPRANYTRNGTEAKYQYLNPSNAVWTTARDGSTLTLLPRGDAQVYARLDRLLGLVLQEWWINDQAINAVAAFARKFRAPGLRGPNISAMNDEELERMAELLDTVYVTSARLTDLLHYYNGTNEAILSGARTEAEVQKAMYEDSAGARKAQSH